MRRHAVVAAVLVLLLAGCGKTDDADPTPRPGTSSPADENEADENEADENEADENEADEGER